MFSSQAAILIPNLVNTDKFGLLSASLTAGSWSRINCAVKSVSLFASSTNSQISWPLSSDFLGSYINWAFRLKGLRSSTISAYISALKTIHLLKGLDSSSCNCFLVKSLIRGASNLEIYNSLARSSRKVFTLPALKILGHQLAISDFPKDWIQVVWAACCCAFFGSLRIGEIIPLSSSGFLPQESLLWKDVSFVSKDHVILHIKCSKARTKGGESVDLFSFPGHGCCPVKALSLLKASHPPTLRFSSLPVFASPSGSLLTASQLNSIIRSLLKSHLGDDSSSFSCHSFRAAIPSLLAQHPELASSDMIMGWGRWKSSAYLSYTRLRSSQRRKVFAKIADILNLPRRA